MWWLVWVVLVLGALGTAALLGLRLWRQVKALGREASGAAQLMSRLEPTGPGPGPVGGADAPHVPGPAGDEATLRRARADRARIKARRAALRAARLDRVQARWRAHGLA
ncbi:hypothetical protein [Georgenia sp. SYP-B2076]|uniref:hypothetical protein n=1 Tax=Georgenia sp. SYP-B2076 TaxID=2495881 RepID=UPI000F8D5CC3|nr:hypothetical protein [Georgenia sp. SYP-B2076]